MAVGKEGNKERARNGRKEGSMEGWEGVRQRGVEEVEGNNVEREMKR
tara:strand:+ start:296 stop:436 length:141 start_codon:yes stop_codon:yes gene_type:complete